MSEPANHVRAADVQLTWDNPAGQKEQDITAAPLLRSITSSTYLFGGLQSTDHWRRV